MRIDSSIMRILKGFVHKVVKCSDLLTDSSAARIFYERDSTWQVGRNLSLKESLLVHRNIYGPKEIEQIHFFL